MEEVRKEVYELKKGLERLRRSAEAEMERCERVLREHREDWKEWKRVIEKVMECVVETVKGRKGTGLERREDKMEPRIW